MLEKLSEKLRPKFPATTFGCSMVAARLDDAFLEAFQAASKPTSRAITTVKREEKEKKERRKKNPKIEKPKDVGHFRLSFDFSKF